ncbi:Per1-like protein [Dipodascopsis uninucleata]
MRNKMSLKVKLLLLGFYLSYVTASIGDRLPEFKNCVYSCIDSICESSNPPSLPLHMKFLFWDCQQDCDYQCQRSITANLIDMGKEIVQFHGKWPFKRVWGIQEPASVIFSILNFLPHYLGFLEIRHSVSSDDNRSDFFLRKYYLLVAIIGMNAWIWSAVFHCRDFVITERLDYFSAGATVLSGFYFAVVRLARLDKPKNSVMLKTFTIVCISAYLAHVYYLSFVRFSYSYNMLANVLVGLMQNALWIYYSITRYFFVAKSQRRKWTLWPLLCVLSISCGMSLELLDFPPLGDTVDAHSLWHASTIIPGFLWYEWLKKDASQESSIKHKD